MEEKVQNNKIKRKTKLITYTAILTALYVIFSALLKIPVAGTISLDLGYIALMVAVVCLGPVPAFFVGALGAAIESMMFAQKGISPGWIVMNAIIGYFSALIISKASADNKKEYVIVSVIAVLVTALVGVAAKTAIDCLLYSLPLLAKIPTGITAWLLDSFIMLAIGLPLSLALKKRLGLVNL